MSKALIIAEKPSVANDIVRSLGGFTKHDEYFENDDYIVSSAVGHLLEIAAPEEYDVKRGKWSFAHLPVIPPHFDLNPIAKTDTRLRVLTRLIKRKDVTQLINACDAGREGELIFRYIAQHAKSKQPVQRLWLQSMTPAAIRDGFAKLRSDDDMQPLADAARCRSEADWLVGINGTRAMTAFNSKGGGFFLTTVGRVQTPTLSIVVEREEKIRRFVPRDYWEVKADFVCAAGFYEGRWYDPAFKKTDVDAEQRDSRLWSVAAAESVVAACRGKPGNVTEESKPSSQLSPLLFDLTSLQREANGRFGFSAKIRWAWPKRCMNGTRYSRIRVPIRVLCPKIIWMPCAARSRCSRKATTTCRMRSRFSTRAGSSRTSASSIIRRSAITSPSSPPCKRRRTSRSLNRSCTTWWSSASWPCFSPRPNIN